MAGSGIWGSNPGCLARAACRPRSHPCSTQLYLPEGSLECDVTTAKSSGVNIVVLPAADDGTPLESPVPEQFVTRWVGGRWLTEPVSHSAG